MARRLRWLAHRRPFAITLGCLILLAATTAPAAEKGKAPSDASRVGNTITMPYALGIFDLGIDVHGMRFVWVKVEQDKCEVGDECDMKLTIQIENEMDEDGNALVTASILDSEGRTIVSEEESKGVEEDEDAKLTIKLEIPAKATASVEKLRLELDAEED